MRFRPHIPTFNQIMAVVSILGFGTLCCVFGAAIMYFGLPGSEFLQKAFSSGQALHEQEQARAANSSQLSAAPLTAARVSLDRPDMTWDGFTLYTTSAGARATLMDMRGNVVHEWELPFEKAWPKANHIQRLAPDKEIHWFKAHLFPNGDLLAVYHALFDSLNGYGLAKMDKDSRLLWTYNARVHHDVDVAEDGTIYTLTQKLRQDLPPDLSFLPSPWVANNLVVLSSEGQELDSIPIAEAFRDSPYALLLRLSSAERVPLGELPTRSNLQTFPLDQDFLHTNSVRVLSRAHAAKFPLFKPGQVLLSLRSLHALAVLDPKTHAVVWASQGVWRSQHDAEFLDNGHLLVFDNLGDLQGSRILEYDPVTQGIPRSYENENAKRFTAVYRGVKQRLPNGNTLIAEPDQGRLFEVTPSKELVWEWFCQGRRGITGMHRYGPGELTFLKPGVRPRP
jgi:Arylsulfotransferase (ASST)